MPPSNAIKIHKLFPGIKGLKEGLFHASVKLGKSVRLRVCVRVCAFVCVYVCVCVCVCMYGCVRRWIDRGVEQRKVITVVSLLPSIQPLHTHTHTQAVTSLSLPPPLSL